MDEELLMKAASRIGSDDAVKVVKELLDRGKATEDELARATGIKLNDLRKVLFKLHSFSLAFSESVQDKKTGWLIFYWRIQPEQFESLIRTQKRRILEKLDTRLQYEKAHEFYRCPNEDCPRWTFEEALESLFKCPKCGSPFQHFDNVEVIARLSELVGKLKKELESE